MVSWEQQALKQILEYVEEAEARTTQDNGRQFSAGELRELLYAVHGPLGLTDDFGETRECYLIKVGDEVRAVTDNHDGMLEPGDWK